MVHACLPNTHPYAGQAFHLLLICYCVGDALNWSQHALPTRKMSCTAEHHTCQSVSTASSCKHTCQRPGCQCHTPSSQQRSGLPPSFLHQTHVHAPAYVNTSSMSLNPAELYRNKYVGSCPAGRCGRCACARPGAKSSSAATCTLVQWQVARLVHLQIVIWEVCSMTCR